MVAEGVLDEWPTETDRRDAFAGVVHSVCANQTERLRASLTLDDAGLGNHATPYVRLAYEETVWLAYLASISADLRNELLVAMDNVDKVQRVTTQREHFGDREGPITGLTAEIHEDLSAQSQAIYAHHEDLAKMLQWERRPRVPNGAPAKIKWLAERTNFDVPPPHGFLAECSSQYVHFSAYQALRGIKLGDDGLPVYFDRTQRELDAGFALGWSTYLLLYCFLHAREWTAPRLDFPSGDHQWWPLQMERILKELVAYGEPPLMYGVDLLPPE